MLGSPKPWSNAIRSTITQYLAEFSAGNIMQPDYDFGSEFQCGFDLIIDGLNRSVHLER